MKNLLLYFENILKTILSLKKGLVLTGKHFLNSTKRRKPISIESASYFKEPANALVTIQYPQEQIPVPDVGRYRLYMETEDCIGCDQCARICPVDCITIEKVKAVNVIGLTSDGTKKRFYLPTFDIDMAKCCYCGLCTIVCPTECLIMTKSYDYSEYERKNLIYHFGNLSPEEKLIKEKELEEFELAKKSAKATASQAQTS